MCGARIAISTELMSISIHSAGCCGRAELSEVGLFLAKSPRGIFAGYTYRESASLQLARPQRAAHT
jgi:hypothetical protein